MSKLIKILIVIVVVLIIAGIGFFIWRPWSGSGYYAIYLRTGDLYFGQLVRFPSFGLKNIYTIQVNSQNQQNPLSIQKFTNIFWGPEDFMKINKDEIVWMVQLNSAGQLAQLIKNNPNLVPAVQPTTQTPAAPASTTPKTPTKK